MVPSWNDRPLLKTRITVAKALGKSATTLDKAQEVHEVASAPETPEPVRQVAKKAIREMDRTGKVDGVHRQVKQAQDSQQHAWEPYLRPENVVGTLRPGQLRLVNGRLPCEVLQTEPITRSLDALAGQRSGQRRTGRPA